MNHKFEVCFAPIHGVKVFRCVHCAMKTINLEPYFDEECVATATSKTMNALHNRRRTFSKNQRHHFQEDNNINNKNGKEHT